MTSNKLFNHFSPLLALILFGALIAPACSSQPKQAKTITLGNTKGASLTDSSVDISYVLGHSHRRFVASSSKASCVGQALLEGQVLKQSKIDSQRYESFFEKVAQFISAPQREPADTRENEEACRSPFTVTLRLGKRTELLEGCRSADDGSLAHLVRDGEFLLHSRK